MNKNGYSYRRENKVDDDLHNQQIEEGRIY